MEFGDTQNNSNSAFDPTNEEETQQTVDPSTKPLEVLEDTSDVDELQFILDVYTKRLNISQDLKSKLADVKISGINIDDKDHLVKLLNDDTKKFLKLNKKTKIRLEFVEKSNVESPFIKTIYFKEEKTEPLIKDETVNISYGFSNYSAKLDQISFFIESASKRLIMDDNLIQKIPNIKANTISSEEKKFLCEIVKTDESKWITLKTQLESQHESLLALGEEYGFGAN